MQPTYIFHLNRRAGVLKIRIWTWEGNACPSRPQSLPYPTILQQAAPHIVTSAWPLRYVSLPLIGAHVLWTVKNYVNIVNIMYFSEERSRISIPSCHDNIQQNTRQILNSQRSFWKRNCASGALTEAVALSVEGTNPIKLQTLISKAQDTEQTSICFPQNTQILSKKEF